MIADRTVDDVAVGQVLPQLVVPVSARTVVMGTSASRDWQPQHHDHQWAVEKVGSTSIFMNTPNQAGWIERYLTDWSGPRGRLARLRFRMRSPICAGDELTFRGTVTAVTVAGACWADVAVTLSVGERIATECTARIALPATAEDNPWQRRGADWAPDAAGDLEQERPWT